MSQLGEIIFKAPENWPIAMAVVAACIVAMIWSNVRQTGRIGFFRRRALDLFRAMAVVGIGLSILKPALVQSLRGEGSGKILAIMDESWSMGMRDWRLLGQNNRGVLGQLLAIARGRGLADEKSMPLEIVEADRGVVRLKAIAEEMKKARREVDYSKLMGRSMAEAQNRLDEHIAAFMTEARVGARRTEEYSAAVSKAFADLSGVPGDREAWINRLDRNLSALVQAVNAMNQEYAGQWFANDPSAAAACSRLSENSRLEMAFEALNGQGGLLGRLDRKMTVGIKPMRSDREEMELFEYAPKGFPPEPSMGNISAITSEIARVEEKNDRSNLQAILLFTDGRESTSAPTGALRQANVPVFPIFCAGDNPRDLAIQSVEIPSELFVDEAGDVKVTFRAFNIDARDVQGMVRMTADGEAGAEAPPKFRFLDGEATFSLSFATPGVHRVSIAIPTQEHEITTENNVMERLVKVYPRKPRVLAVEGGGRMEFAAFAQLARSVPWMDFRSIRLDEGVYLSMQDLQWCDVAVIFDLAPESLPENLWMGILEAVRNRGAGLVIVTGDKSGLKLVEEDPLAQLLPARPLTQRIWKSIPGQARAFHPIPAKGLVESRAIDLDANPENSRNKWNSLPGLSRRLWIGEPRSSARVLLVDRDSNEPLLLEMTFGAGKSLFLAFDETRGFKGSSGVYEAFWMKLIRLAMEKPWVTSGNGWSFDLEKVVVNPDETIAIRAKCEANGDGAWPESVAARIMHDQQEVDQATLRMDAGGRYVGSFSVTSQGGYRAELLIPGGEMLGIPFVVKNPDDNEMKNLTGDRQSLVNLAEITGGKCLGLDEINDLPSILENIRRGRFVRREIPLWDSPWLFVLILCCLCAEWSLRKHHGFS